MQNRDDPWRGAGADTRAEVREIFARHEASAPATEAGAERFQPLPPFLQLPRRGWGALSPRGRRLLAALVAAALVALAVAWPQVERDKQAGAEQRAQEAAERRAAQRRALIEDQRPRRAELSAQAKARIRAAGGLDSATAAAVAGTALEQGIARDVRARIAAGSLDGPLLGTDCDAVKVRSASGASYNCFALIGRSDVSGRTYDHGYRFSARAELGAGSLVWCKENLPALHPTSYMVSVPISPECR